MIFGKFKVFKSTGHSKNHWGRPIFSIECLPADDYDDEISHGICIKITKLID